MTTTESAYHSPSSLPRKVIAVAFLNQIVAGDPRGAFERYVARDFKHHNPLIAGDAESLLVGMERDNETYPDKLLDVRHVLEDGDLVAVHSSVRFAAGTTFTVVHLFRFVGPRIVEMWDIAQEIPADSPNALGMM